LKVDGGNEFKGVFHKYLFDNSILQKTNIANRHSSLSNLESLNRQLGRLFNLYMNKQEKEKGKRFVNWLEFVPTVREKLNEIREKKLPATVTEIDYPVPNDTKEITNKETGKTENVEIKPKFKVGQFVFRYLDKPRNALNKDQSTTQIREGDILWDNIPREILKVFTYVEMVNYIVII
jgi:hypothetical protein